MRLYTLAPAEIVQSMPLFVETLIAVRRIYIKIVYCYLLKNFNNLKIQAKKALQYILISLGLFMRIL